MESVITSFYIQNAPYYRATGQEVALFRAACESRLPVLLKGPTGCGKSRFVAFMAHQLKRPLITVACHEDLTASDLVGRYLLRGDETVWSDGPLTLAARYGAICYLDEVVEARKDTTVVIHPLTDDRRMLPIEKKGEILPASPDFMLVMSYNPGYQSVVKDLKQSTRQRFVALEFQYPPPALEMEILLHEAPLPQETARRLIEIGRKVRHLTNFGLEEGVSTRLLVYAGQLMGKGFHPHLACQVAIANAITDDAEMRQGIMDVVRSLFEEAPSASVV